MLQVVIELLSYIVIEQLFLFLDLDGLFEDFNSVTTAIDSSFLGVRKLLFVIVIIIVNCYYYHLH